MRKQETTTTPTTPLPTVEKKEVDDKVHKTETINFRLTKEEKAKIKKAATALGYDVSGYLLKCHEVISAKV